MTTVGSLMMNAGRSEGKKKKTTYKCSSLGLLYEVPIQAPAVHWMTRCLGEVRIRVAAYH